MAAVEAERCRTCLDRRTLHPLSTAQRDVLVSCTGIYINDNDSFPRGVCQSCADFLEALCKFRQRCIDAQARLISLHETRVILKRVCFDDDTELKSLTDFKFFIDIKRSSNDLNRLCLKNQNTVNASETVNGDDAREREQRMKETGDEDSFIVNFPDKGIQVVSLDIDGLMESILSSNTLREDEKQKPNERNEDFDNGHFDSAIDYKFKDETQQSKKLTRLDLIDGKPNKLGPNKCKLCKKICSNIKSFYKHLNNRHFGNQKYILCEFCAMRFPDRQKLLRHCRARHGLARDDSFPCAHCPFRALDKEQLQTHERRVHTRERPFVCDHCGASFYSRRVLTQHARQHTDDKPYQCDKCPSKFKTKQRLSGHNIKTHLRRSVLACPLCDKRLSKAPYMTRHIHREHGLPLHSQPAPHRLHIQHS